VPAVSDIAARTSGGRFVDVWVINSRRLLVRSSISISPELLFYRVSARASLRRASVGLKRSVLLAGISPMNMLCHHVGMRPQSRSIQYTIRGIPPEVDSALRRRAAQRKQSLNRFIVDELTVATGGHRRRADFSHLVGRWTADSAFDKILAAQRQIDPDRW